MALDFGLTQQIKTSALVSGGTKGIDDTVWTHDPDSVTATIPQYGGNLSYGIQMQVAVGNWNSESSTIYQSTITHISSDSEHPQGIPITLDGLEPETIYFFRAFACLDIAECPDAPPWTGGD